MNVAAQTGPTGATRWRRFAALLIPATLAAITMGALTAEGALAASFAVAGENFKISADSLEADGFAQYGSFDTGADGRRHPVAPIGIRSATLTNLCESALVQTPMGTLTMRLTAGRATPVKATNLVVDADQLGGDARFTGIEIGRDASTMDEAPGHVGPRGAFGQQARTVTVNKLRMRAWATTAGTFTLSGLKLDMKPGKHECF